MSLVGQSGALTFGYGCTVYVRVDVEAGDAEVDVIIYHSHKRLIHRVLGTVRRQGTKTSGQLNYRVQY